MFSTNHHSNLLRLDNPGRVRSQITNVVCQIQLFDFDCNLVVARKVIIRIPPVLGLFKSSNKDHSTEPTLRYDMDPNMPERLLRP